ncbi:hypothetical protein BDV09DRAFT_158290 [Aspergillus tetrazonus]
MNWNTDADAKLFFGILNQLRDAKFKLDTKKLAEFMVPSASESVSISLPTYPLVYQHDGFDMVLVLMPL